MAASADYLNTLKLSQVLETRCVGVIYAQDDDFYRNFTYPNTWTIS